MALNPDEESHAPDEPSRSTPTTAELPPQESTPTAIPAWMIPAPDAMAPGDRARIEPPASANGVEAPPLPVRPAGSLLAQQPLAEAAPAPPAESTPVPAIETAPALPLDTAPMEATPVVIAPAVEPLPALDTTAGEARPAPAPRRPWLPGSAPTPAAPAPVAPLAAPAPTVPMPVVTTAPIVAPPAPAPVTPAKVAGTADTPAVSPPAGALMLLPGEEVLQQLGALYLTNRRAILYAPTILRAAFLHDIDAVGTLTERSGGWMFLVGLLLLGGGTAAAYNGIITPGSVWAIGDLFQFSPLLVGIPLALLGIFTLVSYFFWVKRSLFLSVGGRPLIVVSVTGWNPKKLEPVDQFVNTFSAAKDRDRRRG